MRIGQGYDAHKLIAGDGIILGGIKISCDFSIEAYSDGDILVHALIDALLGAASYGDLGTFFPSNDINFKDMPNIICSDFVFDDVVLKECVINYNCEKTYPVGKMHKGILILRGDDKEHNGDCNPITSVNQLIEQNEIETVYDSFIMKSKNKKYNQYCVYGSN